MKFLIKTTIVIALAFSFGDLFSQCYENTHSNNLTDNWLSCNDTTNPNPIRTQENWIMYDLGYEYEVTTTHVWNYNTSGGTGQGFKDVVIDYSLDGTTWDELGIFLFEEASGTNYYRGKEGPDFNNTNCRYILISAISNHDLSGCFGLAEIKFNVASNTQIVPIENEVISISLFPIPAEKILNIQYLDLLSIQEIRIRNTIGQEIQRYHEMKSAIDISYLPEGAYFLEFLTKKGDLIVKGFVKTNQ